MTLLLLIMQCTVVCHDHRLFKRLSATFADAGPSKIRVRATLPWLRNGINVKVCRNQLSSTTEYYSFDRTL